MRTLKEDLLVHVHQQVTAQYGRKTDRVFYDVTNYQFEIDVEDDLRKKGACKRNSRKPLVQMGLLLDQDAIPITYRLFPGNTHDSQTLMPMIQDTRKHYGLGRIVTVADKAMNSGDNVAFLMVKGDGFIFSQKVRGADSALQSFVLDPDGYRKVDGVVKQAGKGGEDAPIFLMKSRPYPHDFWVTHADDVKRKIPIDVKQIACYNEAYARRQRHKREEAIQKAKYDGYYCIVTSEYTLPDREVVGAYHDLWEIERSFRITKDTLETQPANLSLEQRIDAHFMTCFYALLFLRLLSKVTGQAYAPEQLVQSLKRFQMGPVDANLFRSFYYDEVIETMGQALGIPLDSLYYTKGELRKLNAATKRFKPRP